MIRKVRILPFLTTGVLLFGTLLNAQNNNQTEIFKEKLQSVTTFQKSVHKTGMSKQTFLQTNLPKLVKIYTKDFSSWWHINNLNHTYDENSRLVYSLETTVADNLNSKKDTLLYNTQGRLIQRITNAWQDDAWVDFERLNITYNANGYKINELIENFNIDTWDTTFFEEMNFENNLINEYYSFMGFMGMKIEIKIDFNYDGSNVLQEMILSISDFETGELINFQKLTDLTFETYTGNYEEDKIENAEVYMWNNEWIYFGRFETSYDNLGGYVRLYEMLNGSVYENFQKETEAYDEYSNLMETKTEIWENNTWIMETGEKNILTYENNNLTECIFQSWDMDNNTYTDLNKEEYADFLITGISKPINREVNFEFQMFPNPAYGEVNIRFDQKPESEMSVELFDILGKSHLTNSCSVNCDNFTFDLRNINQGYYFLKITTPYTSQTKKLIISK